MTAYQSIIFKIANGWVVQVKEREEEVYISYFAHTMKDAIQILSDWLKEQGEE